MILLLSVFIKLINFSTYILSFNQQNCENKPVQNTILINDKQSSKDVMLYYG